MRTRGAVFSTVITVGVAGLLVAAPLQPARAPSAYAPAGTPIELGLAGYAKVLCSAVFVSGRDGGFSAFSKKRAGAPLTK